jgi:hypothetical protein
MSLNQLINSNPESGKINGHFNTLKCENDLTLEADLYVDEIHADGDIKTFGLVDCEQLKLSQRTVTLNGILTEAERNLVGQAGNVENVGGIEEWTYQKYGDTLMIQGQFVASIQNAGANYFYVEFTLPSAYISTDLNRQMGGGAGSNIVGGVDTQPYVLNSVTTETATTVRLYYHTGDGSPSRVINAQNVFMFNIALRSIFLAP